MISGEFRSKRYYKLAKWKKKCLFSNYLLILPGFCAVEKFSHFGLWFLAWNLGRNWLLTSYFSYFLCRLKFNGFTSRKNLSSVNISSLWRKSLSCSAKRTELQILFFFLILDLWRAKPLVNTLDSFVLALEIQTQTANMAITLQTSFQTIFRIYEIISNWKQNN